MNRVVKNNTYNLQKGNQIIGWSIKFKSIIANYTGIHE